MASDPKIAVLDVAGDARQIRAADLYATLSDYWTLTKPEVNFLILITTFAGFYLAPALATGVFRAFLIVHTLLGTLLVASGAGTLNQFLERSFDAQMRRTARRPLASGRLKASHVLWFGISLSLAGTIFVHATQTKNSIVYFDRSISGCRAPAHWMGCGARAAGLGSLDALCRGFPLAIPALHGHSVDVSRRLRPRGISCFTFGRAARSLGEMAELSCFTGAYPVQHDSGDHRRIGSCLYGWGLHSWFDLFLF